jgi:hypothetical protein
VVLVAMILTLDKITKCCYDQYFVYKIKRKSMPPSYKIT